MSQVFASRLAALTLCYSVIGGLACSSDGGSSGGTGGAIGTGGSGSGGIGSGGSGSGGSGSGGSGSGGSSTGGSGSGGAVVDSGTDVADGPVEKTSEVGDAGGDSSTGSLTFSSSTLRMMGANLVFPASASAPMNQSPAFAWSGAPAGTLSFVITLKDLQGDTHWAIWDISPTTTMIAAGLPRGPIAVPAGAKQKAIYGDTRGYEGPGAPPPAHSYEFELWALNVATLPANVASMTPAQMRATGLPPLKVSPTSSVKILAKGNLGGI
jgi:phosphatidylethanolamine-binding protein (PEBP) family uncharacterized protein